MVVGVSVEDSSVTLVDVSTVVVFVVDIFVVVGVSVEDSIAEVVKISVDNFIVVDASIVVIASLVVLISSLQCSPDH